MIRSWLQQTGVDVKDAQGILRHSRASTTQDVYQQRLRGGLCCETWLQSSSKCSQLQPNWKMAACKLLNVVARDGIEPPTPAFSGLRSTD